MRECPQGSISTPPQVLSAFISRLPEQTQGAGGQEGGHIAANLREIGNDQRESFLRTVLLCGLLVQVLISLHLTKRSHRNAKSDGRVSACPDRAEADWLTSFSLCCVRVSAVRLKTTESQSNHTGDQSCHCGSKFTHVSADLCVLFFQSKSQDIWVTAERMH